MPEYLLQTHLLNGKTAQSIQLGYLAIIVGLGATVSIKVKISFCMLIIKLLNLKKLLVRIWVDFMKTIVTKRMKPISSQLPDIPGNMPYYSQYLLLDKNAKDDLVERNPKCG